MLCLPVRHSVLVQPRKVCLTYFSGRVLKQSLLWERSLSQGGDVTFAAFNNTKSMTTSHGFYLALKEGAHSIPVLRHPATNDSKGLLSMGLDKFFDCPYRRCINAPLNTFQVDKFVFEDFGLGSAPR
jgi:hypothetical protein